MSTSGRDLVWFDGAAGLTAGVLVLALLPWLPAFYALPMWFVALNGATNLAYGLYSSTLARQRFRPRWRLTLLIAANATWAVVCAVSVAVFLGTASVFGIAHLVGEGLFVGGLAVAEFRARERLQVRPH